MSLRYKVPNSITQEKVPRANFQYLIMPFEYALNLSVIKNKLSNVLQSLKSFVHTLFEIEKNI